MSVTELSAYFAAIQNLPGSSFSAKFKSLMLTAKKLAETIQGTGDTSERSIQSAVKDIPEPIRPLVRAEIGNLLQIKEEIILALKSEDSFVVDRALKAKWFFEDYSSLFQEEIFPFVSIQTRSKIIKALGYNLKDSNAAEQCYIDLSALYGNKEASYLLLSCSESFILTQNHINARIIKFLFYKYPKAIIKHLKDNYNPVTSFLPKLLKDYPGDFVELMKKYQPYVRLSKARTRLFLKSCKEDLIQNGSLFLPCMDLKVISKVLTEDQWISVISSFLPKNIKDFHLYNCEYYLEYVDKEKKYRILLSSIQNYYNVDLDCPKFEEYVHILPEEQRVQCARRQLEKKETQTMADDQVRWICYLPKDEAMTKLKNSLASSSSSKNRCCYLSGMIEVSINNLDDNLLLEVLDIVWKKHRNENSSHLIKIFEKLETFEKKHWDLIYKIIKVLYAKGESRQNTYELVKKAWEQSCIDSKEAMELLADLIISGSCFLSTTKSDKLFLEELLPVLSSKKLENSVIVNIVEAIYKLNKEEMSVRNYPWIVEALKKIFEENDHWSVEPLKTILKQDRELYDEFVKEKIDVRDPKVLKILQNNPEKVLERWEEYTSSIYRGITKKSAQRFVSSLRWHDLGRKLAEHCWEEMKNSENNGKSFIVLALMVQGEDLEKVITPLIPNEETNFSEARRNHQIQTSIARAINAVNPPVSLEFVKKFCKGDGIHMILRCLYAVARRKEVNEVTVFAEELMERSITVKKHGVRLFLAVQGQESVFKLWKIKDIRKIVFDWMLRRFRKKPSKECWELVKQFVEEMELDSEILEKLVPVPKEFASQWMKTMMEVFGRLKAADYIVRLLKFDGEVEDEVQEEIIERYVMDLTVPIEVWKAGFEYLVIKYVGNGGEKLDERLGRFQEIFGKIVEAWDVPHPEDSTFYPANYFLHQAVYNVTLSPQSEIRDRFVQVLMELCVTLLQPHHDPDSCLRLRFNCLLQEEVSASELAGKISEVLPGLIGAFSTGMIQQIAHILLEQMKVSAFSKSEEFQIELVQSLIRSRDDELALLAAAMMIPLTPQLGKERVLGIIKSLQKYPSPSVMSIAYYTMNR